MENVHIFKHFRNIIHQIEARYLHPQKPSFIVTFLRIKSSFWSLEIEQSPQIGDKRKSEESAKLFRAKKPTTKNQSSEHQK